MQMRSATFYNVENSPISIASAAEGSRSVTQKCNRVRNWKV